MGFVIGLACRETLPSLLVWTSKGLHPALTSVLASGHVWEKVVGQCRVSVCGTTLQGKIRRSLCGGRLLDSRCGRQYSFCCASDHHCSLHGNCNVQATAGVDDDDDYDDIAGRPGNTIGQPSIMNGLNRQMIHTNSTISNAPNVPVIILLGDILCKYFN